MRLLDRGFVELLDHMGNDNTVVSAARVSYLGESKGTVQDAKLIHYLMRHRHTSPFEQVEFQFRVKCPLFVRSQWHRHRTWSYNEVSRRYTSENIEFYTPTNLRVQAEDNKQASLNATVHVADRVFGHSFKSLELYNEFIENGVAREQARMVLPQNMYTTFYAKTDLHNLLHFIGLRSDEHSQWEIRQYSDAMLKIIAPIVPWSVDAYLSTLEELNPNLSTRLAQMVLDN